jgi:hypothetical protein
MHLHSGTSLVQPRRASLSAACRTAEDLGDTPTLSCQRRIPSDFGLGPCPCLQVEHMDGPVADGLVALPDSNALTSRQSLRCSLSWGLPVNGIQCFHSAHLCERVGAGCTDNLRVQPKRTPLLQPVTRTPPQQRSESTPRLKHTAIEAHRY